LLGSKPSADIAIDVLDAKGNLVRHLTSAPSTPVREAARAPMEQFWLAPPSALPLNIGLNRVAWDLRYDTPPAFAHSFAFYGNPGATPALPEGPLASPGVYTVRLTVDGKSYTRPLTVRPDPRTHIAPGTLGAQHAFMLRLSSAVQSAWTDFKPVSALRAAVRKIAPDDTASELGKTARTLAAKLDSIAGDSLVDGRQPWDGPPPTWSFADLNGEFGVELTAQDNADQTPTRASLAAARSSCNALSKLVGRWKQVVQVDVLAFNAMLVRQGMPPLAVPSAAMKVCAA
jgi:hypothetical protein